MSLILEKCRNGFLMLPKDGMPADAFILAENDVSQAIKDAFDKEEDVQKLRAVRPELVNLSKDMADFPVLTDTHMAA